MDIVKNKSLKKLNTFNIDINAKYFTEVWSEEELCTILSEFRREKILLLGGGSNILFTKDFDGLVIKNSIPGISVAYEDEEKVLVKAGAGVVWNDLVLFCIEQNYGGIENLILIPGTVGAAPIQNIGAYGVELKDVFNSLKGIYINDCNEEVFVKEQCNFGYRDSIFKNELKGKFVITYVLIELSKKPVLVGNYGSVSEGLKQSGIENPDIADIANVISNIRISKLPDPKVYGNAGSFFKNPVVNKELHDKLKSNFPSIPSYPQGEGYYKIPAGWLIETSGWKGKRIGNAGSHKLQSLVLVNYGGATSQDVLTVARSIKETVKQMFNIDLHEEVNII